LAFTSQKPKILVHILPTVPHKPNFWLRQWFGYFIAGLNLTKLLGANLDA
jgi:hypothetical protein